VALPALDLLASAGSQGDVGVLRDEMCVCQPAASIHILAIKLGWEIKLSETSLVSLKV
jgi:hypothetical protein